MSDQHAASEITKEFSGVLASLVGRDRVLLDEPMAKHTAFRIGGPAHYYVQANNAAEIAKLHQVAYQANIPFFLFGRGSNILVADEGIPGLVVANFADQFSMIANEGETSLWRAESGTGLPRFCFATVDAGWQGLEWGGGVPGTVGGALVSNAGAHGGQIKDTVVSVEVLSGDRRLELTADELALGYRTSRWKNGAHREEIILAAQFRLVAADPKILRERVKEYKEYRQATQPAQHSIGSMFKNPPGSPASGKLIHEAELKGTRIGGAEISAKHGNFIVNADNARAADVVELIRLIRSTIYKQSGVKLHLEVEPVGAWHPDLLATLYD